MLCHLIRVTEKQAAFFGSTLIDAYAHQIISFKDHSQILDKQFKHVSVKIPDLDQLTPGVIYLYLSYCFTHTFTDLLLSI